VPVQGLWLGIECLHEQQTQAEHKALLQALRLPAVDSCRSSAMGNITCFQPPMLWRASSPQQPDRAGTQGRVAGPSPDL
jgi:hypothetical protein